MAHKMYIDYAGTFKGYYKQGRVTAIDPQNNSLTLDSGETMPYDVLVIGTGTTGLFPSKFEGNKEEGVQKFADYAKQVCQNCCLGCIYKTSSIQRPCICTNFIAH